MRLKIMGTNDKNIPVQTMKALVLDGSELSSKAPSLYHGKNPGTH
jgi:hypothetical protein